MITMITISGIVTKKPMAISEAVVSKVALSFAVPTVDEEKMILNYINLIMSDETNCSCLPITSYN